MRRAYAIAARGFYGAQPKTCVAVTGTNGKTSVAAFCRQLWAGVGHKSASMGTLGVVGQKGDKTYALTGPGLTSPDAAEAARLMAELARKDVTHVALEASSHGIDQRRLDGVALKAAAFTNLTQDHLDYHGTMQDYRAAKMRLFETLLPRGRTAVLNADSDAYSAFASASIMAGLGVMAVGERGRDLTLIGRRATPEGQRLTLDVRGQVRDILLPLAGAFQASNALVAAGLCIAAGDAPDAVIGALEGLTGAQGRLQRIGAETGRGEVYVDYAHTPDGLETVLNALRPHATGRLIAVVRRGRRPGSRQAAADGRHRRAPGRRRHRHRRQSPFPKTPPPSAPRCAPAAPMRWRSATAAPAIAAAVRNDARRGCGGHRRKRA